MRRRAALLFAAGAFALAGCGGGGGPPKASSPLDEALGYLPADAPLAVVIPTDVDTIERNLPGFGSSFRSALQSGLQNLGPGVEFKRDIEPLLGNDLVVGGTDAMSLGSDRSEGFVGAWQVKDAKALDGLVKKGGGKKVGEAKGATIYRGGGKSFVAVRDDVAVLAGNRRDLEQALERRSSTDRLTESKFEGALSGLDRKALVRVYANVGALLRADPKTSKARRVKWVSGLRTFAATLSLSKKQLGIEYSAKTEGVTDDEVPLASGAQAPAAATRPGEIGIALRDASHVLRFAEAVGKAINPTAFAVYDRGKSQIGDKLGIDFDRDLIGQFSGDTSVSIDIAGKFAGRSELKDPAGFKRTLGGLVKKAPQFFEGAGLGKPTLHGGLYEATTASGRTIAFGVVGNFFAFSNDPARLRPYATQPAEQVPGAEGSLVVTADAGALAQQLIARLAPGFEQFGGSLISGALGRLTASVAADTGGLHGKVGLEFKG